MGLAKEIADLSAPVSQAPMLPYSSISNFPSQVFHYVVQYNYTLIIFTVLAVRLVGGPDSATGRVEIYYNGTWGTICDYNWDIDDAHVVCRQLGYRYALNAYGYARYGQGPGPISLSGVNCLGSESSLLLCRHSGVGSHNCGHSKDASVRCGNIGGENN